MIKTLIKHGNSYAVIIDKPIMELLQIKPDTDLDITTNGDRLIISPIREEDTQASLNKIISEVNKALEPALKKLTKKKSD